MRRALLAAGVLLLVGQAMPSPARAGTWLDAANPRDWNQPGAKLPRALRFDPDPFLEKQCAAQDRAPGSKADQALAKAGWKLVGPSVQAGEVEVIAGRSGSDGQCRPLGYQLFVFSHGAFAGTLAPRPMDSRTDGSAFIPTFTPAGEIELPFSRYAPRDPLCCPSRTSTVVYRVDARPAGPVVKVVSISTVMNGITGDSWRLVRIVAEKRMVVIPDDPDLYTLQLGDGGRASIRADCNRGNGTYTLDGASLTFGPIATTRAACPPGSISDRYLTLLANVASWKEAGGKLELSTRDGDAILEFRRAPPRK